MLYHAKAALRQIAGTGFSIDLSITQSNGLLGAPGRDLVLSNSGADVIDLDRPNFRKRAAGPLLPAAALI